MTAWARPASRPWAERDQARYGVTINAGPSDSVHLRGLTIQGLGSGLSGILFKTGGNFAIENCVIRGFTNAGIAIQPTGSNVVTGVLRNVITNNNNTGIAMNSDSGPGQDNVTIVDSEASNNSSTGIVAAPGFSSPGPIVMVRNSVVSYNSIGRFAQSSVLRVGHSVVTGNDTGVHVLGTGSILTYGDNDIDGNTNNNTGVLTPIPTH
jgi:hypothetical protein